MGTIEIIVILFALFALSRAFLRFRDKEINAKELVFWSIIWIAVIVVVLIPGSAGYFAKLFGIGRPVDLLIYISIILLFYLTFRLYVKIDKQNQQITKIVREVAIKKAKKK